MSDDMSYEYKGFQLRVFGSRVYVTKEGETHSFTSLDLAMKQIDEWLR